MIALVGGLYLLFTAVGLFDEDGSLALDSSFEEEEEPGVMEATMVNATTIAPMDYGFSARGKFQRRRPRPTRGLHGAAVAAAVHTQAVGVVAASGDRPTASSEEASAERVLLEDFQSAVTLTLSGFVVYAIQGSGSGMLRQAAEKRLEAVATLL